MRFVMHFVPAWVFKLADALGAGDMDSARAICIQVSRQEPVEFNQNSPFDHAMRLVVAKADNHLIWLEEAEAFLAVQAAPEQAARWERGTEPHEAVVAAYHLAGLMRLEEPTRAAAHFTAALSFSPNFLPAQVELEILKTGRDRRKIFGALGVDAPLTDWAYMLAASELAMASRSEEGEPARGAKGAICLRGLCSEHTPALVRLYRWLNPTTPIFVATWGDTPPDILNALSEHAQVAVAPPPTTAGSQNKNRQIVLARAALLTAKFTNISHALLVRTDIALFRPAIIQNLESTYRTYPVTHSALAGRYIVSDIYTRKYLPYHASDLLTYGAVSDLLRLWSAPYETGDVHASTEQYLGSYLYHGLGLKYADTPMNNYYGFLRDFFVIRDFSWFDGCWLKKPQMRTAESQSFADACVSQVEWERLYDAPQWRPPDVMGAGDVGVVLQATLGLSRL